MSPTADLANAPGPRRAIGARAWGIVWLVAGLFTLGGMVRGGIRATTGERTAWQAARGTIVATRLDTVWYRTDDGAPRRAKFVRRTPLVAYAVAGRPYDVDTAAVRVTPLATTRDTTIWYDPREPARATLAPEHPLTARQYWLRAALPIVLAGFLAVLGLRLLVRGRA